MTSHGEDSLTIIRKQEYRENVSAFLTLIGVLFLATGAFLAVRATTSNRIRWSVMAPLAFGTGTLLLALSSGDWGPIAVTAGIFFYAAINYRNIRKRAA